MTATTTRDVRATRARLEAEALHRARLLLDEGHTRSPDPLEQAALEHLRASQDASPQAVSLLRQRARAPRWMTVPQPGGSVHVLRDGRHLRWVPAHVATPDHVAREVLLSALGAEAAEGLAWDFGQEHELALVAHGGTWSLDDLARWAEAHR